MARKRESAAEREARERLRDRYDAEVKAVSEFFGYAGQIDQLNAKIEILVERQGVTVAQLAEASGVTRAADTVCWPAGRVREALASRRRTSGECAAVGEEP